MANDQPPTDQSETDLSRRSIMQATSALAGTGLVSTAASRGVRASSDGTDYETTEGKSDPEYEALEPEEVYFNVEYEVDGESFTPLLHGSLIRPDVPDGVEVPVILTYTPYGDLRTPQNEVSSMADDGVADYFVPRGYARLVVDVLGTNESGGCWDMGGLHERRSGAEAVEWAGTREWSSGRVGMIGASYPGGTQFMTAIADPDHLTTIFAQVPIDSWYHASYCGPGAGGVKFKQEYAPVKLQPQYDGLGLAPPTNVTDTGAFLEALQDNLDPCDTAAHFERANLYDPRYDEWWRERDYLRFAENVTASVFIEGGYDDTDARPYPATRFFKALPDDHPKKLVMGQWGHTTNRFADGVDIRHAWFDHWLKDLDTGIMELPAVDTEAANDGRRQETDWPPAPTERVTLRLTYERSNNDELGLKGETNPRYQDVNPPMDEEEMLATETAVRNNYLKFVSGRLREPIRISGAPELEVVATSTEDSTLYTPVLYEVDSDGSANAITRGALNARNRNGKEYSEPVPTDRPYEAPVGMWPNDWVVDAGNRVGVIVASDNFRYFRDDPDGNSTNELLLADRPGDYGSVLTLPVSEGAETLSPYPADVPYVEVARDDDGSVFTGGQTNGISLTVQAADRPVLFRDRVPDDWDVVGGDSYSTVDSGGDAYIQFQAAAGSGDSRRYFAEAPVSSGGYTFGPVEFSPDDGESWYSLAGTTDMNFVAGVEQP